MQREIICDILALAAPDSMLKGYAQCWVDLVQAMQPSQGSQEAVSLARLIAEHSCCPRLSFHVGAAAAPILSQGIVGEPSLKLAGRVLSTYMRPNFEICDSPELDGIIELLAGMLSAAPGATMAVAQKDDTREEVRLSKEAEMLGLGAVTSDNSSYAGTEAYAWVRWFDWINSTHYRSDLDITETAMSLTLAMSKYSWLEMYDGMPEILDLLEFFLLEQVDAYEHLNFDNMKVFESALVGALLGSNKKVVKIDI